MNDIKRGAISGLKGVKNVASTGAGVVGGGLAGVKNVATTLFRVSTMGNSAGILKIKFDSKGERDSDGRK
jgi:hypothetical protein